MKLIDFGLALRGATRRTARRKASLDRTLVGSSIAGTLDYAAPEQMGKLKGVPVGPYSDVYGFGKTCCFALFGTPQPTYQHWQSIPRELADLLGRCLAEQPKGRPQDFAAGACGTGPAAEAARGAGAAEPAGGHSGDAGGDPGRGAAARGAAPAARQ